MFIAMKCLEFDEIPTNDVDGSIDALMRNKSDELDCMCVCC